MPVAISTIIRTLENYQKEYAWDDVIACGEKALKNNVGKAVKAQIYGYLGEAYLSKDKSRYAVKAQKYLQLALREKQLPRRLQYLCFLSEAADKNGDFVLHYNSCREAVDMLKNYQEELSDFWLMNMHNSLAHAAVDLGYYDECEQEYLAALQCTDDIDHWLNAYSAYLLISHYKPYTTAEIWQRQQIYAQNIAEHIKPLPPLPAKLDKDSKIRVGYLSPDFHRHAMFPIYYGFFACFDKARFAVIAYQLNDYADEYTGMIRNLADEYYDVHGLPMAEIARKIRSDDIDILVDLASHSSNTGLPVLAYRPARIHISGLGSLCTAGFSAVDYYITDEIVDPPGLHDAYFAEKPLYMQAQFSYTGTSGLPVSAGAPCLNKGYIQFAVVQNYRKLNNEMLSVWKEILEQVPDSRLLIKSVSFFSKSLLQEAKKRLAALELPMERLDFESATANYMERYLDIDIILDTYPYPGGSTTLDALYMGCPVLTLYGERRNTRFGYSILHSVGLDELAVDNVESYVQKAVVLANDKELLDILHKNLRKMMKNSSALSPRNYVSEIEQKYRQMIFPELVKEEEAWQRDISQAYQSLKYGDYCTAEQAYKDAGQLNVSLQNRLTAISSYILASHYRPYDTVEVCQRLKSYAACLCNIVPFTPRHSSRKKSDKLRIGYISPDFRRHALFPIYYGLFACYDKQAFTVTGYQLNRKTDAFTKTLQDFAGNWHYVADNSLEDIARQIRRDEIDILVDLAGHSADSGLPVLAYRPAPVQISGLGSLCTTGVEAVDYFLTDEIADPPGLHDEYYTEKLLYLPCQFSYAGRNDVSSSKGTPALKRGFVQLGCFQEYTKINDEILAVWREILHKLPEARLLIKSIPFEITDIRQAASKRLTEAGLPMERVLLEAGDEQYMERYLDVDIILDTYPYTGGRTTLDALYMGCPVVSRYGERRNTRFGYSILHSIGMDELAVSSREQYIDCVITLAKNIELLDDIHRCLRQRMQKSSALSPIKYTQRMEKIYTQLARKHSLWG